VRTFAELVDLLSGIDGRGYGGYKQLKGAWGGADVAVVVDHVQGDPFATPSRVHVVVSEPTHGIPASLRDTPTRRAALTDFLLRRFAEVLPIREGGSGRSGEVSVDEGGAEILARSACGFEGGALHLRIRVGLPARGRRISGRQAAALMTDAIPHAAKHVRWSQLDQAAAREHVAMAEDHAHIAAQLVERRLVAFVRDGSILPRQSGVSSRPLAGAVAFESPPSLRVVLDTLHSGPVSGMGIPAGVTLVTGGGFHGKTTLLEAIAAGIDPHVPGDGREWVVTAPDVVKLRSEDGRSVVGVDLRPFITELPQGRATETFTTPDASGSTSLAAAIVEAIEQRATGILLDEDTSATNLLIRDARMQALVARETITPLIDRVRELHEQHGVSTVLVVGGSGDYLEVADLVILMEDYLPRDVTAQAREIAAQYPTGRTRSAVEPFESPAPRSPVRRSLDANRGHKQRVRARGLRELSYGDETIDLSALAQLVDESQVRAIGVLLRWIDQHGSEDATLGALVDAALDAVTRHGLYALGGVGELAAVRRHELAGAMNRLRGLQLV